MSEVNATQREFWNEQAGPVWVRWQERLDEGIRPHGERAMDALAPLPGEAILDVGCGCGETSLELARRVAPDGRVLGVDLSGPMLDRARERASAAAPGNVRFEQADAQRAPIPDAPFDALFSRFGVMFFEDPSAAFRNLASSIVPGGRIAFVCWRGPQDNPWITVPMGAIQAHLTLPAPPPPNSPGMFGFADPDHLSQVLSGAGLSSVEIEPLDVAMTPGGRGASLAAAAEMFVEVGPVAAALREAGADADLRSRVQESLAAAYAPHHGDGGVTLGSGVWRVTARTSD